MNHTSHLVQLHHDLWVAKRPLSFFGMKLGSRMTVVRFGRQLLLHSPVQPDDELLAELGALGEVRWVVGPNKFHHMHLGDWMALGAEAWAVPGLHTKRSDLGFAGAVGDGDPWPSTLETHALSCIPFTDEAVFLHAPSRTLVVTDLLMNLSAATPWVTRSMMWMAGGYPGVRCSHLERLVIKRAQGRRDLERILSWDFERIVLAHGEVVAHGGHQAMRKAYAWLGLQP